MSSKYVVGLCVGNDVISSNVCSGLRDCSFSQDRLRIRKVGDKYQNLC